MELPNGYILEVGQIKAGQNGIIYKCTKGGQRYALKVFVKNVEQYLHEVNICTRLKRHVNIIKLIDHFEWDGKRAIVLEYCQQDLLTYLKQNPQISELDRLLLFGQIVSAFKSIHEDLSTIQFTFQHRDIKPENLMLGEQNKLKIIDFGESRLQDDEDHDPTLKTQICGTPGYLDPMMEYFSEGFSSKSDLWSLGATLFYILTNTQLKLDKSQINSKSMKIVNKNERNPWKMKFIQESIDLIIDSQTTISDQCKKLLTNLLKLDTKLRYGWENLFADEFVKQILEHIPQVECDQTAVKRPIRLTNQWANDFLSINFQNQAGPYLTQAYNLMITKGQFCYLTAQKMFKFFQDQKDEKDQNNEFFQNWQNFEKCNYLLHLRSLIIFNSYNQILTLKLNQYGREKLDQLLLQDLMNPKNQELYERIQLQIYYLFDNVRKCMQGNGLEGRITQLKKSGKQGEIGEYPTELEFSDDEKDFFTYKKNDQDNKKNRPDYFDNDKFYQLLNGYLLKCIKVFINNYKLLGKEELKILSDMIICMRLEDFFLNFTMQRMADYKRNFETQSPEVLFTKLKVNYNYLSI